MSAKNELASILEQWLRLTREECAAIQAAFWPDVAKIQSRKTALRPPLAAALKKFAQEGASPNSFRPHAGRILSLLNRNADAVAAHLRRARDRQEALEQSKRNLSRIKRSYLRPQRAAAWHSYS